MSYWTIALATGSVAMIGLVFAALIFRLDESGEEESGLAEQNQRWTSII